MENKVERKNEEVKPEKEIRYVNPVIKKKCEDFLNRSITDDEYSDMVSRNEVPYILSVI